jgi:drug/metabolite transporter (DMT)-like permease
MILACGQLALAMALVGANVVVARILAGALPIPVILFVRCTLAFLALAPFAGLFRPGSWQGFWPGRAVAGNLALQAAFGTLLYNIALLAGLRRTGALEGGLVLASLPAVVAVGAFLLLRERLGPRRWIAVALAAAAMAALTIGRGGEIGGTMLGDLLVLLGVCGEAAYVLLSKRVAGRVEIVRAAFWMQVFSAALLAPLALPLLDGPALAGAGWRIAALLVFHSLTASVLCLLLWYRGMQRVPASLAGIFTGLLPATAAVLAILVLGEAPTPAHAAGFALILLSILFAARS